MDNRMVYRNDSNTDWLAGILGRRLEPKGGTPEQSGFTSVEMQPMQGRVVHVTKLNQARGLTAVTTHAELYENKASSD
jgi:hypothetical protein